MTIKPKGIYKICNQKQKGPQFETTSPSGRGGGEEEGSERGRRRKGERRREMKCGGENGRGRRVRKRERKR